MICCIYDARDIDKVHSVIAETTVAEGGRNPVARLWGRRQGENLPPEPTFSYASVAF